MLGLTGIAQTTIAPEGTVFVPSIEQATWSVQEQIAARLSSGTGSVRIMASTAVDPIKISEGLEKIASRLYDLETKNPDLTTGLKDKVRELIEEHKPIKDKYKALGGKLLEAN